MALRTMPPSKASSSACHQTRPVSTGSPAAGLALISKARFGAVRAAQREHAVEGRGRGGLRIGFFQDDFETVGATTRTRLRGMVDQRTVVRKKRPGRIAQPGESGFRNQHAVIICAGNKAGFERCGEWQLPAGCGEELRLGGIGGNRPRDDGQAQRQFGAAGYADVGADEPGRLCRKDGCAAWSDFLRHADGDEKIRRAGIAVIANPPLHKVLGHWPRNGTHRKPRRELPVDRRRQARIAGIAPVDMPPGFDREMKIDPQGGRGAQ